jgi:hypothetical protein
MKINKSTKYGAIGVVIAAVVSFVVSGVLAATSITVNSNNKVTLGAGAAYATTCDADVTVTPLTSFDTSDGTYKLTTISVTGIAGTGGESCANKTLNLAFLHTSGNKFASWTLPADNSSNKYDFGGTSGGSSGSTYFATATFAALSASGLTSIAVSIN